MLPLTCMLRAARCHVLLYDWQALAPRSVQQLEHGLSANCYDLPLYDAFRVTLHVANAADRRTPGDIDEWLVTAVG